MTHSLSGGFVGRVQEIKLVDRLAQRAAASDGNVLVIEGEPGIGKSRLALEALAVASGHGLETLSYSVGNGRDTFRVFGAERSGPMPLAIIVDDLEWADAETAGTIAALAARTASSALLLICVVGRGSRSADVERLLSRLGALAATRVVLGALSHKEATRMASYLLKAQPGPALRRYIACAGGNPSILRDLVGVLLVDGELSFDAGRVEIFDSLPPSSRAAIERRLAPLDQETVELLRVASVLGTTFDIAHVAAMLGQSTAFTMRFIRQAIDARVIVPADPLLAFADDVIRGILYYDIAVGIRAALHRDAGWALAAAGGAETAVAAHFELSFPDGTAVATRELDWLTATAERAAAESPAEAIALYERILEMVRPDHRRRAEIERRLQECHDSAATAANARERRERLLHHDLRPRRRRAIGLSLEAMSTALGSDAKIVRRKKHRGR